VDCLAARTAVATYTTLPHHNITTAMNRGTHRELETEHGEMDRTELSRSVRALVKRRRAGELHSRDRAEGGTV
jgi:hypothetical protein